MIASEAEDPSAAAATRPVHLAGKTARVETRSDGAVLITSTEALAPYPESWNARLALWAQEAPDRVFLTEPDGAGGRRAISYGETLRAVQSIGQGLLALDLGQTRPLAILAENSIDCALVTLAALWIGVPASPLSPAYALKATDFAKLTAVMEALAPGALYVADGARYGAALRAAAPARCQIVSGGAPVDARASIALHALKATTAGAAVIDANAAVTGDTIGKIMFTSGSSSAPKPVIQPHRMLAVNRQQCAQVYKFLNDAPPVMVDWLPWHHTFGGNNNFGQVLWCGGALHIDDGGPTPAGIGRTVELLRANPPTFYINTPGAFEALLPYLRSDSDFAARFFSRLQLLQYGGALLAQHVWRAIDEIAVATIGQRVLMVSGLGSTECGPTPVQSTWEQHRKPEAGLPLPGVEAKLVPTQDTWELRLRGACVTPGYWRRPDLTAAAFDDEGFFKTGDAVKPLVAGDFAQGLLFDGRISENFKLSSGTWVQAVALRTSALAAFAPLMKDAVITGHGKSEVGVIGFPDMAVARDIVGGDFGEAETLAHPKLREWVQARLNALAAEAHGASERIARLTLEAESPSFDNGELTDKGAAASRIVLARRADVVQALHAAQPAAHVFVAHI
ncbi:MAG TPA: feruloyl-CoA synthase [Caulobacterales bacterium]|nr:feruloyl-CoA synthase [Caulobacterales bacterium]